MFNQLTYAMDLTSVVDDATVQRVADGIVQQRVYPDRTAEYHRALMEALDSGAATAFTCGDEAVTRDYLVRLRQALEDRRPWPEPPFVKLDPAMWPQVGSAPVVGHVPWTRREVSARLNRSFADVDDAGTARTVVLLRLRTGQVVGLRMSAQPREPGAAVLTHDDPAATVAALRELIELRVEPAP